MGFSETLAIISIVISVLANLIYPFLLPYLEKRRQLKKNKILSSNFKDISLEEEIDLKVIELGLYPQSSINKNELNKIKSFCKKNHITKMNFKALPFYVRNQLSNYCFYIDIEMPENNKKYRGLYFTNFRPAQTGYPFGKNEEYQRSNGYNVEEVYWFKFEPIKWFVNQNYIFTKNILDSMEFNINHKDHGMVNEKKIYPNDYESSSIRKWINTTLLKSFMIEDKQKLSKLTNGDYLSLMTYEDVIKLPKSLRKSHVTDYAKCVGVYQDNDYGAWWVIRKDISPEEGEYVSTEGEIDGYSDSVTCTDGGIRVFASLK